LNTYTPGCALAWPHAAANLNLEVTMTKLFSLWSARLLTLGGAKASTRGEEDGTKAEPDFGLYFP
jgi:hypothetical protein